MRIAVCFSGQLRNARLMINNHIKFLFIPLLRMHSIDVFFYTDVYNTTRLPVMRAEDKLLNWHITPCDAQIMTYLSTKIKPYCSVFAVHVAPSCAYQSTNYTSNIVAQLIKFQHVLTMALETKNSYDWIIRLRPDVYFESAIELDRLRMDTVYQNYEGAYSGDAIQIFAGTYLQRIVKNCEDEVLTLTRDAVLNLAGQTHVYEHVLNNILQNAGLTLNWLPMFASRWYGEKAVAFPGIQWRFVSDWKNMEYPIPFDIQVPPPFSMPMKELLGLLPASGTATRMNGIPKFLLPCPGGNLLDRWLATFYSNGNDDVLISVAHKNAHFIAPLVSQCSAQELAVEKIVHDTATMSETVLNMVHHTAAQTYVLAMPDTFLGGEFQPILAQLHAVLAYCSVAVVLWPIKESQYGKLGQVSIAEGQVTHSRDKDPSCRYPYAWGVIGWTFPANNLIDPTTPHVGYMIERALSQNMRVGYVLATTEYFDCGTPQEYFSMIKQFT